MTTKLTTLLIALALAGVATAADFDVNQVDLTFDPDEIMIEVGDTVHWNWSQGIHTVTSGDSPGDPDAGDLFDAPLDAGNPVFSYTFDTAGTYNYFCRPHFSLQMIGTVIVEEGVGAEATSLDQVKNLFR
jgi:plastocyanin